MGFARFNTPFFIFSNPAEVGNRKHPSVEKSDESDEYSIGHAKQPKALHPKCNERRSTIRAQHDAILLVSPFNLEASHGRGVVDSKNFLRS